MRGGGVVMWDCDRAVEGYDGDDELAEEGIDSETSSLDLSSWGILARLTRLGIGCDIGCLVISGPSVRFLVTLQLTFDLFWVSGFETARPSSL